MSKLPTDFVKAPATQQPKPRARRPRKASLISADPVVDPKEITLHLTDDEYRALEAARQALHHAGSEVTLEQMIHRVFADWMVRVRAVVQPATPPTVGAAATESAAPRDERMHARLRDFVAAPIKIWRELARQIWRASPVSRRFRRAG
jgi:hypothetical protein